jgi:hypothetical protein
VHNNLTLHNLHGQQLDTAVANLVVYKLLRVFRTFVVVFRLGVASLCVSGRLVAFSFAVIFRICIRVAFGVSGIGVIAGITVVIFNSAQSFFTPLKCVFYS